MRDTTAQVSPQDQGEAAVVFSMTPITCQKDTLSLVTALWSAWQQLLNLLSSEEDFTVQQGDELVSQQKPVSTLVPNSFSTRQGKHNNYYLKLYLDYIQKELFLYETEYFPS